ncbi:MAG: hypothetical protein JXA37_06250 [Chloroflexia bacterium]|nr:hypothetical protein [Chloroflexia bacterium]
MDEQEFAPGVPTGEDTPLELDEEEEALAEQGQRSRRQQRSMQQKQAHDLGIGTIRLITEDGKGGIIAQFDSPEEAYFRVDDIEEESALSERGLLPGRIVQFFKEQTDIGIRARDIVFLDRMQQRY